MWGCLPSHLSLEMQKYRGGNAKLFCCSARWITKRIPQQKQTVIKQLSKDLENWRGAWLHFATIHIPSVNIRRSGKNSGPWNTSGCRVLPYPQSSITSETKILADLLFREEEACQRTCCFLAEDTPAFMDLEQMNEKGLTFSVGFSSTGTIVCVGYHNL